MKIHTPGIREGYYISIFSEYQHKELIQIFNTNKIGLLEDNSLGWLWRYCNESELREVTEDMYYAILENKIDNNKHKYYYIGKILF